MAKVRIQGSTEASIATPATGWGSIFLDSADNTLKIKKSTGAVNTLELNSEAVADIIANVITAGSGISIVYNDPGDILTISVNFTDLDGRYYTETEINSLLSGKENTGVAAGLLATHEAALDPHSQYETSSEVQARISTHEAALDPHPQYLTPAEGDVLYAPISHVGAGGTSEHADATISVAGFMSATDKAGLDQLNANLELVKEPTGVEDITQQTLSFVDATRTFTVTPTGLSYDVYIHGQKITISTPLSVVLANTAQNNFILIDNTGNLVVFNSFSVTLVRDYVYLANIYWSPTLGTSLGIGEERHGLTMDWATHEYLHTYFGARIRSDAFTFGNFVLNGGGASDNEVKGSVENGILTDEDIRHSIVNSATPIAPFEQILSTTAELPILYKNGASGEWVKDVATNVLVKSGTSRIQWNQLSLGVWSAVDAAQDEYVAMWVIATNYQSEPIRLILGQNTSTTLNDAININTYESLNFSGLPVQEFKVLYRLIFQTNSGYVNTTKASLVQVLDLRRTIDQGSVVTMVTDHGNLTGLSDDDHLQYHTDARGDIRYYTKAEIDALAFINSIIWG